MLIICGLGAAAVVLSAFLLYVVQLVRRRLAVRAEARLRLRLVARQQLLAELRIQRAMQDTVRDLFAAVRDTHASGG